MSKNLRWSAETISRGKTYKVVRVGKQIQNDMKEIFFKIALITSIIFALTDIVHGQTQQLPNKAKLQAVLYPNTETVGVGYIYKNQFVENQEVTFFNYSKDRLKHPSYYIIAKDGIFYICVRYNSP